VRRLLEGEHDRHVVLVVTDGLEIRGMASCPFDRKIRSYPK
jgi:hypothetical protein